MPALVEQRGLDRIGSAKNVRPELERTAHTCPRLDVAGAVGVPLLSFFLWRSRYRATYAGVFLVVAALELYGTSIGTWRWAVELPGLGIPDGNPPSGVASGYVWFDVMAMLVAPSLVAAARLVVPARRWRPESPPVAPASLDG